jgi:hypothetical protein
MNTSTPLVSYQIDVSKFGENNSLLKVKTTKLNDVNYTIVTLNESLAETTEKHSKEILPQEENTEHQNDNITVSDAVVETDVRVDIPSDELKIYRSIVLDDDKKVLCFSPVKSIEIDEMRERYNSWVMEKGGVVDNLGYGTADFLVNETIEGTMINLFYDTRIDKWEIATRASVGGNYWFYRTQYNNIVPSQMTFRKMFLECFGEISDLDEISFIDTLDKSCCYSFVMQHSDNHIVLPIVLPTVFLVAVYRIKENNVVEFLPQSVYEKMDVFQSNSMVKLPMMYGLENDFDVFIQKYANIHGHYRTVGVMITHLPTGDRYALPNPVYEELRELRGNNPNLQYQYFCLLKAKQVGKFIHFFPHYKGLFYEFWNQYNQFITNVHKSYYSYYVKKENLPISKKYFVHVAKIHHNIFIPSLTQSINGTGEKLIITRHVVKNYFDAMNPSEILYYLNYENRKVAENVMNSSSVEM